MRLYEFVQGRVDVGYASQQDTIDHLQKLVGRDFKVISTAAPGSKAPDIKALVQGVPCQFEVKGREDGIDGLISIFNLSANRGVKDTRLDFVSSTFEGRNIGFETAIDNHRIHNRQVGYPFDRGAPKSGKVPPSWKTTEVEKMNVFYSMVLDHLHSKGDNYFVLHKRGSDGWNIFWTGLGKNVLKAPPLPHFTKVVADTGGGQNTARADAGLPSGKTLRFAIKVKF